MTNEGVAADSSEVGVSPFRVAISMTSAWATSAAIATGIGILVTMGGAAFWVWMVLNGVSLPLFAVFFDRFPEYRVFARSRISVIVMVIVDIFMIYINQQAVFEILTGGVDLVTYRFTTLPVAIGVAVGIGTLFVGYVAVCGLSGSIRTDIMQYAVQVSGCICIFMYAVISGVDIGNGVSLGSSGIEVVTALWLGIGLLGGPMFSAQQWSRIERVHRGGELRAGVCAFVLFEVYAVLVFAVGLVMSSRLFVLSALLFVVIAVVSGSTIDAAASGLYRLCGSRRRGILAASIAVFSWPLVREYGVVVVFGAYSTLRAILFFGLIAFVVLVRTRAVSIDDIPLTQFES